MPSQACTHNENNKIERNQRVGIQRSKLTTRSKMPIAEQMLRVIRMEMEEKVLKLSITEGGEVREEQCHCVIHVLGRAVQECSKREGVGVGPSGWSGLSSHPGRGRLDSGAGETALHPDA